jgi:hypothetical protein
VAALVEFRELKKNYRLKPDERKLIALALAGYRVHLRCLLSSKTVSEKPIEHVFIAQTIKEIGILISQFDQTLT